MEKLVVETRDSRGKGASYRIRREGKIPGVLYGLGKNCPVTLNTKLIYDLLLKEGGRNELLSLSGAMLEGKRAIIKDFQIDPLSRELLHVDLLEIDVSKTIEITVPINIVGKSPGVAEGGVLNFVERQIEIRCLPTSIPKHIDIDVSALMIGHSVHLNDIIMPAGVEKMNQGNPTLVAVVPPTKEEEAAPSLAPTAEPEVITAKKPEGEEEGAVLPAKGKEAASASDSKEKKEEKKKEEKKK